MFVWPVLIIAVALGAVAAGLLIHAERGHQHVPRIAGVIGALAVVMAIASCKPLMLGIGHQLGAGPLLLLIIGMFAGAVIMVIFDYRPREGYKQAHFHRSKRKRSSGSQSGPGGPGNQLATTGAAAAKASGGGGGNRASSKPHLLRPLAEVSILFVGAMLLVLNLGEVGSVFTHGWGMAINMVATHGKGA